MKRYVDGQEIEWDPQAATVISGGDRLRVRTTEGSFSAVAVTSGDAVLVSYRGRQYRVERKVARRRSGSGGGDGEFRAPMPGQIVDVLVELGQTVTLGQKIVVLEAMKTQQPFVAPFAGVVTRLEVAKGDQVAEGKVLAVVEPV